MRFYKFALYKRYFDIGYGVTSYLKYFVVLGGFSAILSGIPFFWVLIGALVYGIVCFYLGFLWIKLGIFEAEQEVSNVYNLFVKQLRKKIKKKTI